MIIYGHIVDPVQRRIFPGSVHVENGRILSVNEASEVPDRFILPGFVDAHIHIESSMLVPSEFARLAVLHGTVATVSDPHEIANVLGKKGVYFMVENGLKTPFKFYFGAPSCVPATSYETAGAVIDSRDIMDLMAHPEIRYLAEMMNYPGVLHQDEEVMRKLAAAKKAGKPIDGHAPGLRGEQARQYAAAGISTDHECFSYEEALEKLQLGMKVIIREGSAAKNFAALIPLLDEHYENMMFCSDDKHPDDLILGHINQLVRRAVQAGNDLFKVLHVACVNPVRHYDLPVGLLQKDDPADLIIVKDLKSFEVTETYIQGERVASSGKSFIKPVSFTTPNQFNCEPVSPEAFRIATAGENIRVIEALDGELITNELVLPAPKKGGLAVTDPGRDILKFTVVNRYRKAPPAIAFIKGFGLQEGAIASSVGHDSHNILAVGVDDEALARAVNLLVQTKGGIAVAGKNHEKVLPLPVAGIMSDKDGWEVGRAYAELDQMAKSLGSTLKAPFMTLSFMALLVIPDLKLSDKGLFSGRQFSFVSLDA